MSVFVFGPSAAESSWEDAQTKVRADLWRPSSSAIPDDQVDRALHSALQTLESERRWLWLENITGTLAMPAATDNIALPAVVKFIGSLAYLSGTNGYDVLTMQPVPAVRQMARGSQAGQPAFYARMNAQLYFDCAVAEGDEFELIFTARCPEALADAKLTPPVTLTLQMPAIVAWAAGHVAQTFLHDDDKARRQFAAYERLLDRMFVEEDTARSDAAGGGCVVPDDFYFQAAHGS